ncbi:hypothetical protein J4216_05065 [Candidatus Woesearchaeota archaeon]|nr:hypothetical protein [Candidatus Woesearchaeota archaeon]
MYIEQTRKHEGFEEYSILLPLEGRVILRFKDKRATLLLGDEHIEDAELSDLIIGEIGDNIPNLTEEAADLATRVIGLYNGEIDPHEAVTQPNIPIYKDDEVTEVHKYMDLRQSFYRGWQGKPDKTQREALEEYGLEYVPGNGGSYGKIRSKENPGIFVTTSNTPSDTNAGRQIARHIIKYILKDE